MTTVIFLPDDVFREVEKLARSAGISRSRLVSNALREYVARHAPDEITEAMNRAVDAMGKLDDAFPATSAMPVLRRVEW